MSQPGGHAQSSVADLIAFAATYEPPSFLPPGDDAGAAVIFDIAKVWALHLADGDIDLDAVYSLCKWAAMTLQVHTEGRRRWKDTKPFLEWLVETTAGRMADHLEVEDGNSLRQMRQVALVAVSQGRGADAVRMAVIHAASAMPILPPETLLHEAYAWAVAEARRNARWMMQREAQAQ